MTARTAGDDGRAPIGSVDHRTDRLISASFRHDARHARMHWSDELFALLGLEPGDVVPTPAMLARHVHPDDRGEWDRAVADALADSRPVSVWHRVVTTRGRTRNAHTVMRADRADGATVLLGVLTDVTEPLRDTYSQQLHEAVERSAQSRSIIDQAKGMLMATLDLDDQQAFDLLRWHSSFSNIKVRDVSRTVVDRMAAADVDGTSPRLRMTKVLDRLAQRRSTVPEARVDGWISNPAVPDDLPVSARISDALLPRTLVRAVAAAGVSITIADFTQPDQPLVYVNPAFERLTGYSAAEILGRNCRFLQGADTDPDQVAAIRQAVDNGQEILTLLRNYRRDGTAFWNELHMSAVRTASGRLTHYIGYQMDVTERVERDLQLERLAYRDAATDLPNRAAAHRQLQEWLDEELPAFSVVLVRLLTPSAAAYLADDPETVGRAVVAAAAERLQDALPPGTFLARIDDERFLAALPAEPPAAGTVEAAFAVPVEHPYGAHPVSVEVGVARYPGDGRIWSELLAAAGEDAERSAGSSPVQGATV
ncbi:PAS domain-containing protein [Nakamurella endophytica]|uniref:PAS domain S-box-containing protein n=1 Tax=Nakamurella endophytica TaxID=1748367 RepID=A0A917WBB2_9ACTN|nr:PAS domain-containing protein [Nakamurella endophytica]GGL89786.1 hypothetical protein GCM10011594_06740 [Nakamurella endophytica]